MLTNLAIHSAILSMLIVAFAVIPGCTKTAGDKLAGASYIGDVQQVQALLEAGVDVNACDRDGFTALHQVSMTNNKEVALELTQVLLDAGADVRANKTPMGFTPLHCVAMDGYIDVARLLIDAGADVTARTRNGFTPLDLATEFKHTEMVAFLKESGG